MKKDPSPRFSMDMIEGDRIDATYTGTRIVDLVEAIVRLTGQTKGEFESTADFNTRKAAALNKKILGNSNIDDNFAFVFSVKKGGQYPDGLRYDFNADTGEVRLFALPTLKSFNGIGAPDYHTNKRESSKLDSLDSDGKIESQSTYQGSNAYGATVTVEKTSMSQFGIAVNTIPFLNFERELAYSNPIAVAAFKIDNAKAAREMPALKALVIMKLAEPLIVYDFSRKEPKRDSPSDISMQRKYLTGNILGIVFYSGLTGEVFARLPETLGKQTPKAENPILSQATSGPAPQVPGRNVASVPLPLRFVVGDRLTYRVREAISGVDQGDIKLAISSISNGLIGYDDDSLVISTEGVLTKGSVTRPTIFGVDVSRLDIGSRIRGGFRIVAVRVQDVPVDMTVVGREVLKISGRSINAVRLDVSGYSTREVMNGGVGSGAKFTGILWVEATSGIVIFMKIQSQNPLYVTDFSLTELVNPSLLVGTPPVTSMGAVQSVGSVDSQANPKTESMEDKLRELRQLFDAGLINAEVYSAQQKIILGN